MNVFEAAAVAIRTGRKAAFATVLGREGSAPRHSGARMLVWADGSIVGTIGGGEVERRVIEEALRVIASGRPSRWSAHLTRDLGMCCGGAMEVFVEPLSVREPFVIFGAGHVAHATAPVLAGLDFAVTVVDEREDFATAERFPGCSLVTDDAVTYARRHPGGADTWFLVVTHDHALDQELCEALLPKTAAWVGMIGSRSKATKFRLRLRNAGLPDDVLARLRSPVGLDIGAETPAEIAVAIASEVIRARRGVTRPPLPLSDRSADR